MFSAAAWAQDAQIQFDQPAQPLAQALRAFSARADREIMFADALVAGRTAPALKGAYTPDTALVALLDGTGLTVSRTASGVLLVQRASDPQSGSAAGDGADQGTVQALVVTAQKREENIQDVPIAMSAFTQEDLTRSQVAGGPDLMTQVPNFTFTKTNFTGYSIQIRGIGTQAVSATTDAAVAVAENNTPFIRNRFFEQEFYDLQRVEVLRGPQGTLYGRNATAGVVNIITAKPTFHFESRLSADVGNYNSTRFEGMLNLPLADDAVALRIAGAWTKRDGYDTNQMTGNRIDGRDLWSTRVSLRVEPTDHLQANLIWEHFNENDDRLRSGKQLCKKDIRDNVNGVPFETNVYHGLRWPPRIFTQGCAPASLYSPDSFQTPNGFALPYYAPLVQLGLPGFLDVDPYLSASQSRDLRVIESSIDPVYKATNDTGELQIRYDLTDHLSLTSETAFARDATWSMEDFNRFTTTPHAFEDSLAPFPEQDDRPGLLVNGVYCDPQLGCSDRVLAADLATAKSKHFSQEFRLASDFDGPFNFSLGANFLRYDTEDKYYVFINTVTFITAMSTNGVLGQAIQTRPWQGSDNHGCLIQGMIEGVLTKVNNAGYCTYVDPNPIAQVNDLGHNYFLSKNPYKLISYAAFGEAYYQITDNLKLTAGVRWTVDRKEAPRVPSELLIPHSVGYPVAEVVKQEWREPTGRLALDWKPDLSFTDETLIYGSYAHGYKAGGANPPNNVVLMYCSGCSDVAGLGDALVHESLTHPKTFGPEFVNAFEVGSKNTLLEGRLTLNGAAFYYDYTGYQISEIVDRSAINHNYDAKVWGLELEADWRPLENLRLGFKGGYENTRVAKGMYAIDLMDRTAGNTDWVVIKPFPTSPSNCIVPAYVVTWPGTAQVAGDSTCEHAYSLNHDPVTGMDYVPNPTTSIYFYDLQSAYPDYPGFDPSTAPNNGEGIAKDLSGNALPNAPRFTATITADYTIPLPSDWLMTLHTDLYYQSEAWTRIFNDPGYDKLKAYTNVNLAAIFSNEDAGWKVMAYVKNLFDKDNITGAFLNSDDTGLTTNVFLNEPRLYGLRVTKDWTGGSIFSGGANSYHPFTVELGGQVERHDAPYAGVRPAFFDEFSTRLDPEQAQHRDRDWGQGGSIRLTYAPQNTGWWVEGGIRWGKTNTVDKVRAVEVSDEASCLAGPPLQQACVPNKYFEKGMYWLTYPTTHSNDDVASVEEHQFADFLVGTDVGVGGLSRSRLGAGVGYAKLSSSLAMMVEGITNLHMPQYWNAFKYSQQDRLYSQIDVDRTFKGAGPEVSWDAAKTFLDLGDRGTVGVSWTARAGVLFGKQKARIQGAVTDEYFDSIFGYRSDRYLPPDTITTTPININRSKSATAPMLDLSLGLSYEVSRVRIGAGYHWERYFNAIDGGYSEHKSYDRTYDGPYFKVGFAFGG